MEDMDISLEEVVDLLEVMVECGEEVEVADITMVLEAYMEEMGVILLHLEKMVQIQ